MLTRTFKSILTASLLLSSLMVTNAQESENWKKERIEINQAAEKALAGLKGIFVDVDEVDFSSDMTVAPVKAGEIVIPVGTPKINVLRQRVQYYIARIDLAQDYPATSFKGMETLNQLVQGKDYFGIQPSRDLAAYEKKQALINKLFADEDLELGDRIFGLMQTGTDDLQSTAKKWVNFIEHAAGPQYLGTSFEKQPTTLGRSLKALAIIRGVGQGADFRRAIEENPDLKFQFQQAFEHKLKPAAISFAKQRYDRGGLLRDWCLPVASAASSVFPELDRAAIGVTTQANYKKTSLNHARALTRLVSLIDGNNASPKEVNSALKTIKYYRDQTFYIGSVELRESGTLKVPKGKEIEVLLDKAKFFGVNGHRNIKTYQQRSTHLDTLFLVENSGDNLALLTSMKTPGEWLDFFETHLYGDSKKDTDAFFARVQKHHAITPEQLKILFLARTILPSDSFVNKFEPNSAEKERYNRFKKKFGKSVRQTSSREFRNYSKHWANVQNGFMEISKGFQQFSLDNLQVTTSSDLEVVRKDFEDALYNSKSVSSELIGLFNPGASGLEVSIDQMTSPRLRNRIGKFDSRLTPEFVSHLNEKLTNVLEYRSYGLAAIDSLERPDLQAGRIMTHFKVDDYRTVDGAKTNTVMHDFVCGKRGGFGGLGQLFRSDAEGYRKRESALDAIASSNELILGDVLFDLALDIKRENIYSDEEIADGARRWITYFRKSQANAQFHTVPDVLTQAIRGTFLTRLVFQSDRFQKAVQNSSESAVGSKLDISHDLEKTVSSQVRKMQSMLSLIDPETASNQDLSEMGGRWQDTKVWYIDSFKWLETLIQDPLLIGEVSRVRKTNRKTSGYRELSPEVNHFDKELTHFATSVHNQVDKTPTIGLATFAMERVLKLERELSSPLPEVEPTPENKDKLEQLRFGKAVSQRFLNDIRQVVADSGFASLSKVTDPHRIASLVEESQQVEIQNLRDLPRDTRRPMVLESRAKAMEGSFKSAVAKAISRIEADLPSDFQKLESQSIRASKMDQFLAESHSLATIISLQPSFVLHDWITQDRAEIMANVRTAEKTADARHMFIEAKVQKKKFDEAKEELDLIVAVNRQKNEQLQAWIDASNDGSDVDVARVLEEIKRVTSQVVQLERENAALKDSEALMRAQAAEYAQQNFILSRKGTNSSLSQDQDRWTEEVEPESVAPTWQQPATTYTSSNNSSSGNSSSWKPSSSSSQKTYTPPSRTSPSRSPNTNSNGNRGGGGSGFFQRLFNRQKNR